MEKWLTLLCSVQTACANDASTMSKNFGIRSGQKNKKNRASTAMNVGIIPGTEIINRREWKIAKSLKYQIMQLHPAERNLRLSNKLRFKEES